MRRGLVIAASMLGALGIALGAYAAIAPGHTVTALEKEFRILPSPLAGAVDDPPGGELAGRSREDEVGPAFPEADVLDVRARRPGRVGGVRVEDGELVAVVLEEPDLRVGLELEPVRRACGVPPALV